MEFSKNSIKLIISCRVLGCAFFKKIGVKSDDAES